MGPKDLESPEMKRKFEEGPVGVLNIRPAGAPGMGKNLVQWFVFALVVSFFVAYVACHALPSGTRVPPGVPAGRGRRLSRLRGRSAAGRDLDGQAVGDCVEGSIRRTALRTGDRGEFRVALAEVTC